MAGGVIPWEKNLVLIVDDEAMILRMASTIVANAGYRAVVASDGASGLDIFREFHDQICLVLTDVVMPNQSGLEMAELILEIEPHARIVFMSGYSDAALEVQARTKFPFIRKPFLASDLLRKIQETLGASGDRGALAGGT
jgi:two-component system, cell cycle sensor histidine kinase and response regulator CckA